MTDKKSTTWNSHNNNNNRSIYLNCSIIWFWLFLSLLCNLLLLFLFICSSGFTITDAEQQHDTVTTTTLTTQSNLHKLPSVQELISPIDIPIYDLPLQQLNMKWANTCCTPLGHQMPLLGVCLHLLNCISSKCQADLMHDYKCQGYLM